jgi:hypothetical protein
LYAEAGQGLLTAITSSARGDIGGTLQSITGLLRIATGSAKKADERSRATRMSPADVVRGLSPIYVFYVLISFFPVQISWSGCKDSQTSADAEERGEATGAMSFVRLTWFDLRLPRLTERLGCRLS